MVLLSPTPYRGVQQVLTSEIRRTFIWSIFVTVNGNNNKQINHASWTEISIKLY